MALEASIRAKGIIQNLIVHPAPIDGKGIYEVDAGGRRLKILQKLAAEGVIDAYHPVPCLIEAPADALETSLVENTIRAAMHPADEFVAMAALIDGGATIDEVAQRFGTSERHVKQRLRLGKLAPELLDAYRNGDISLDVVTAFTLGADHAAQLAVWNQLKGNSYIQPYTVKRLLTESAVPLDSDLGLFVGAEAYEAAGGKVTRDLFSGDDDGFLDDAALVRRLAIEKLEAKADELRPQWAWTKAVLDPEYGSLAQYARVRPKPAEVPAELAAEIERIEQRLGELEEIGDDDFTDELAAEAAQLEERRTEIDEIDRRPRGLFARRTASAPAASSRSAMMANSVSIRVSSTPAPPAAPPIPTISTPRTTTTMTSDSPRATTTTTQRSGPPLSAPSRRCARNAASARSLVDDLKAHRLQITRAHLAGNFEVAFDLALYSLCADLFDRYSAIAQGPLDLRATETQPRSSLNDLAGTGADRWLDHATAAPRTRLAQVAACGRVSPRWRPCRSRTSSGSSPGASPPASNRNLRSRTAPTRLLRPPAAASPSALTITGGRPPPITGAGSRRRTALRSAREILGERWARDHADDKKPVLAAALETAFDPAKSRPASVSARRRATRRRVAAAGHGLWRTALPTDPDPHATRLMRSLPVNPAARSYRRICRLFSPTSLIAHALNGAAD